MKHLFIFGLLAINFAYGQSNLVLNHSFENTSACPQGITEFNLALNWNTANSGQPDCGMGDLYAACSPVAGGANSPNTALGYQPSRTGNHHCGIIVYGGGGVREFIQGTLASPLVAGEQYCVKFYINTANQSLYITDDIGVHFSDTLLHKDFCPTPPPGASPFNVSPQLQYNGAAISDSINWVPLEWTYTAAGGEQYITIGNFKSDQSTTVQTFGSFGQPFCYYFIDDVEVTADACCPKVELVSSTGVTCNGNDGSATVFVTGGVAPYTYAWSAGGSTTPSSNHLYAGITTVSVTDFKGCVVTIDIVIPADSGTVLPVITQTDSLLTSSAALVYQWLLNGDTINGATSQTYIATQSGIYQVLAVDPNGCTGISAQVQVDVPTAPLPPGNLNVTPVQKAPAGSKIQMTWTDYSNDELGFIIYRGPDTTAWSAIDSVATDIADYLDDGLLPNVEYFYKVAAYNARGISAFSNIASTTTLTTGIMENTNAQFDVFPNPSDGYISIVFSSMTKEKVVEVINAVGQQVFSDITNQEKIDLDLNGYPGGVYFVKARLGKQTLFKKVVTF